MSILLEQFETILKRQQREEIVPFLKVLNDAQKKDLAPYIKERANELLDFRPTPNEWKLRATDIQKDILHIAAFVCLKQKEYEKIKLPGWLFRNKLYLSVVGWYAPPWLGDLINKLSDKNELHFDFDYDDCMVLVQSGMLVPSVQLIVRLLPKYPYTFDTMFNAFKPEKLLKYPQTLSEHIWYLFEVESPLDNFGRNVDRTAADTLKYSWAAIFKKYSDENKIDRQRLLKETLLATNKNFSKIFSGWFADMFNYLRPSFEEIIALQKELFAILGSSYPKSGTNALQLIKVVAIEKGFDVPSFLDAVHILLSSDAKSTVTTVLMVLEKLAQKHPEYRERIALMICQVFIHSHDDLQKRAAKVIVKYGDKENEALRNEISSFHSNLMAQTKESLSDFIDQDTGVDLSHDVQPEMINYNQEDALTAIPFPANVEDLIFLASQSFDGNETWHMDILPAALIQFRSQLKAADVVSLEPAFQRAFRLVKGSGYSTNGTLDDLLSWFFIDFGNWMINKFPGTARTNDIWNMIIGGGAYTKAWPEHLPYYRIHKAFLLEVLDRIRQENDMPLLSSPTHAPCWIDPVILIKRLAIYQQAGQPPSDIDLQLAIARCYLHHPKDALQLAAQELKGEFRALITFLLDDSITPQGPFQYKAAWMMASLTRKEKKEWAEFEPFGYYKSPVNNYTGDNLWDYKDHEYVEKRYDYSLAKYISENKSKKVVIIQLENNSTKPQSGLGKFMSKLFNKPAAKPDHVPVLYESLTWGNYNYEIDYTDVRRILSLVPNNIEPILRDFIHKCLQHSKIDNSWDKRTVTGALQFLYETWHDPGKMSYLFLATCMLNSDKAVISLAGEIWIRNAGMDRIDNEKLGKILGELQCGEYAPFKRFTDLVMQQLFRISALHNRQLQLLIESLLAQLPTDPLKGQKRLVEIHKELTAINK